MHLAAYHNATPTALQSARTDLFPLRPRRELPFARAILDRALCTFPMSIWSLALRRSSYATRAYGALSACPCFGPAMPSA